MMEVGGGGGAGADAVATLRPPLRSLQRRDDTAPASQLEGREILTRAGTTKRATHEKMWA